MEYKILEQNGIENESVDGAGFNNFTAGNRNGIIQGILNECNVVLASSNVITLSTGEIIVKGFRVKITTPISKSFTSLPLIDEKWHIVARVEVKSDRTLTGAIEFRELKALQQDSIFNIEQGTYEAEIAQFALTNSGINSITKTMQIIVGGVGNSNSTSGLTEEEKRKLNVIKLNGEADKFLNEQGVYIEIPAGSGAEVEANPQEEATEELNKLKVDGKVYSIPENTGSGSGLTEEQKNKLNVIKLNGEADKYLNEQGEYKEIKGITVDSSLSSTSSNPVKNSVITGALNEYVKNAIENDSPSFEFIHSLTLKSGFTKDYNDFYNGNGATLKFSTQNKNALKMQSLEEFVEYYNTEGNVVTGTYKAGNAGAVEEEITKISAPGKLLFITTKNATHNVRIKPKQVAIEIDTISGLAKPAGWGIYPFNQNGSNTFVFDIEQYLKNKTITETNITEVITKDNFQTIIENYELDDSKKFNGYIIMPDGNIEYITVYFNLSTNTNSVWMSVDSKSGHINFNTDTAVSVTETYADLPLTDSIKKIIATDVTLTQEGVPADAKATGEAIEELREEVKNTGSGIRTLETAPDISTVGYAGEIVQVSNGTAYQCIAVGLNGEGSPIDVVEGTYMQIYADTLNKKMYLHKNKTKDKKWNLYNEQYLPYTENPYSWNLIIRNINPKSGLSSEIQITTISNDNSSPSVKMDFGAVARSLRILIAGNSGFTFEQIANSNKAVLKPNPISSNSTLNATDLGDEAYPFRKLYLNDGIYVNGVKLGGGTKLYQHVIPFNVNGWGGGLFIYSYKGNNFTSQNDLYEGVIGFDMTTRLIKNSDGSRYYVFRLGLEENSNLTLIAMKDTDYTIQEIPLVGIEFEDTVTEL